MGISSFWHCNYLFVYVEHSVYSSMCSIPLERRQLRVSTFSYPLRKYCFVEIPPNLVLRSIRASLSCRCSFASPLTTLPSKCHVSLKFSKPSYFILLSLSDSDYKCHSDFHFNIQSTNCHSGLVLCTLHMAVIFFSPYTFFLTPVLVRSLKLSNDSI